MSAKLIPLSKGKAYAIVDEEDFEYLNQWKWKLTGGRASRSKHVGTVGDWRNGKRKDIAILMHREIMNAPKGMDVDHINHNQLDNRKSNLRVCTHHENTMNRQAVVGVSGYKGVHFDTRTAKWVTQISFMGKTYHIAVFEDEAEAAKEYDHVAKQLYGKFANLNFGDTYVG